jgi:hypothetical protein
VLSEFTSCEFGYGISSSSRLSKSSSTSRQKMRRAGLEAGLNLARISSRVWRLYPAHLRGSIPNVWCSARKDGTYFVNPCASSKASGTVAKAHYVCVCSGSGNDGANLLHSRAAFSTEGSQEMQKNSGLPLALSRRQECPDIERSSTALQGDKGHGSEC